MDLCKEINSFSKEMDLLTKKYCQIIDDMLGPILEKEFGYKFKSMFSMHECSFYVLPEEYDFLSDYETLYAEFDYSTYPLRFEINYISEIDKSKFDNEEYQIQLKFEKQKIKDKLTQSIAEIKG